MLVRKQKGGFVKGQFWRMCPHSSFFFFFCCVFVPSFWFLVPSFRGHEHRLFSSLFPVLYPRSGFWGPGTSAKTTLLETTLLLTLEMPAMQKKLSRADKENGRNLSVQILGSVFGRTDFFADFYFWAAGFFRGSSGQIFSPHFCGKKSPEKSCRKIPCKILQNLQNKNPRHISAEGPGQQIARFSAAAAATFAVLPAKLRFLSGGPKGGQSSSQPPDWKSS